MNGMLATRTTWGSVPTPQEIFSVVFQLRKFVVCWKYSGMAREQTRPSVVCTFLAFFQMSFDPCPLFLRRQIQRSFITLCIARPRETDVGLNSWYFLNSFKMLLLWKDTIVKSVRDPPTALLKIWTSKKKHNRHSWKKCFCLRDPVFWGGIFLILMMNFPNMEEDFSNIEKTFS